MYQSYVKSVKESKYLIRISKCIVVLELWPKIWQSESFWHFPRPRKKQNKNDNPWNLLYILANFYMSGIFSFLNILVQTQLGHYLYHPTLTENNKWNIVYVYLEFMDRSSNNRERKLKTKKIGKLNKQRNNK